MARHSGWQTSSSHSQNVTVNLNHSTWGNKTHKRKWLHVPLSASRYTPPTEAGENPGEKAGTSQPSPAVDGAPGNPLSAASLMCLAASGVCCGTGELYASRGISRCSPQVGGALNSSLLGSMKQRHLPQGAPELQQPLGSLWTPGRGCGSRSHSRCVAQWPT